MYEIAEPGEIGDFLILLLDLIAIEAAWSEIVVQTQAIPDLFREVNHGDRLEPDSGGVGKKLDVSRKCTRSA
jgi:hypothetical protein